MQLCRQVLLAVRLVRQVPLVVRLVVSRVLVESQACRDRSRSAAAYSYSSRARKMQNRGHVLDQTHEQDLKGGGLLVL